MSIVAVDHVAIPVQDMEAMLAFYRSLGISVREDHPPLFYSVRLGDQKINFHAPEIWQSPTFTLRGPTAQPGCGDFCFVWDGEMDSLRQLLEDAKAPIEDGPVARFGGRDGGDAEGMSVYVRDPDSNLLEFIVY